MTIGAQITSMFHWPSGATLTTLHNTVRVLRKKKLRSTMFSTKKGLPHPPPPTKKIPGSQDFVLCQGTNLHFQVIQYCQTKLRESSEQLRKRKISFSKSVPFVHQEPFLHLQRKKRLCTPHGQGCHLLFEDSADEPFTLIYQNQLQVA